MGEGQTSMYVVLLLTDPIVKTDQMFLDRIRGQSSGSVTMDLFGICV